jgi:transcription elongation factor Elf1
MLLQGSSYFCPKCKMSKLAIEVDKKKRDVRAVCLHCGLEFPLDYVPAFEAVDYYNKFTDRFREQEKGSNK